MPSSPCLQAMSPWLVSTLIEELGVSAQCRSLILFQTQGSYVEISPPSFGTSAQVVLRTTEPGSKSLILRGVSRFGEQPAAAEPPVLNFSGWRQSEMIWLLASSSKRTDAN